MKIENENKAKERKKIMKIASNIKKKKKINGENNNNQ